MQQDDDPPALVGQVFLPPRVPQLPLLDPFLLAPYAIPVLSLRSIDPPILSSRWQNLAPSSAGVSDAWQNVAHAVLHAVNRAPARF